MGAPEDLVCRNGDHESAAGASHHDQGPESASVVIDVLKDVEGRNKVECLGRERKPIRELAVDYLYPLRGAPVR